MSWTVQLKFAQGDEIRRFPCAVVIDDNAGNVTLIRIHRGAMHRDMVIQALLPDVDLAQAVLAEEGRSASVLDAVQAVVPRYGAIAEVVDSGAIERV